LAVAAGKTYAEYGKISSKNLRKNLKLIMRATTPQDAAMVYDAILMVSSVQELGKVKGVRSPDLYDKSARKKLLGNKTSLYEVMRESSRWDDDAKELVTGMRASFRIGYPTILKVFRETGDINIATVHTFLAILSKSPDTFIARKVGLKEERDIARAVRVGRKKSKWISETAGSILKLGGLKTKEGKKALYELDRLLHRAGGELNPGTSADVTAASLMVAILCGLQF
jgi:triphosphoribosyl-dephospho-CoA synthase